MFFTSNFYSRVFGALALAYVAYTFGTTNSSSPPTDSQAWATTLLVLCGAGLGLILAPYLTVRPVQRLVRLTRTMPIAELVATLLGALAGLLAGVLMTVPLSYLPGPLGSYSPLLVALGLASIGSVIANSRKTDLMAFMKPARSTRTDGQAGQRTLVDTSVIIDGRISDIVRAGFVRGTLVVPRFVLHELQGLADSADPLTRTKGKRGLDVLRTLQESKGVTVTVTDSEVDGVRDVDDKLVALASLEGMPLLTNDTNLERVAQLQSVPVLNVNTLADAVRVPYVAGERINVRIRGEGREREQGVGFIEDGTMIVVEDARGSIGQEVSAIVTRVITTHTGRIIFAQLDRGTNRPRP